MITTDPFDLSSARGVGVMAMDPGDTTGLVYSCLGRKELEQGVVSALGAARRHSSGTQLEDRRYMVHEVGLHKGLPHPIDEIEMAEELVNWIVMWGHMASRTSNGVVPYLQVICIEDFILGLLTQDRSLLSPVRITARVEQLLYRRPELFYLVKQSSANAKHLITDDRLKKWGLYVPGSDHKKDAVRHLVLCLRGLVNSQ